MPPRVPACQDGTALPGFVPACLIAADGLALTVPSQPLQPRLIVLALTFGSILLLFARRLKARAANLCRAGSRGRTPGGDDACGLARNDSEIGPAVRNVEGGSATGQQQASFIAMLKPCHGSSYKQRS